MQGRPCDLRGFHGLGGAIRRRFAGSRVGYWFEVHARVHTIMAVCHHIGGHGGEHVSACDCSSNASHWDGLRRVGRHWRDRNSHSRNSAFR